MLNFSKIQDELQVFVDQQIVSFELLNHSDISDYFHIKCKSGIELFGKFSKLKFALDMFEKEHRSLNFIRDKTILKTPKVYGVFSFDNGYVCIILEWIDNKIANPLDLETFGIQMADMHQISNKHFGWNEDNYISTLVQKNGYKQDWSEFYMENRILPLLKKGIDANIFDLSLKNKTTELYRRIEQEIPEEPPALIHGDMWSGNYIIETDSTAVLIDPSLHFGHREMDLAMSLMFSSFGRTFYESYQQIYPMEKGFESRLPLLQLYPLLVHAILFQGQYISRVERIIEG